MSRRSLFRLMLLVAAGLLLSTTNNEAQTCSGTVLLASADSTTGPGQIMGGTHLNTQSSNNVREAFNETIHTTGVSRLYHVWRFDNVPAGNISIIREGYRLTTPDGDNFKFGAWYDTPSGPYFIFGAFCTITSQTEGTQKCSFNHETYDYATWYVTFADTNQASGTDLTAVAVDYLALCSEEAVCIPPPGGFCP